ncbi:hypothetical protein [Gemmobacter sp. 24YEA27]|uniref:hypothetical protein n=1 Tax=Gemmobacter sp. 24YEA27 TaxID=3040672 RepID=UPI0024B321F1|nr:hypothetical protein [Gemmobacter sp. 24YEA27]
MSLVVSFGMYDWPEARAANDAAWADIRPGLLAAGLAAPARLVRRNRDLPPVPGGIRGPGGRLLAPDPAQLVPDDLDFTAVWHHPALLLAEICHGVLDHNSFPGRERVGQVDYDGIYGCSGAAYSSALICRPENAARLRDALACSFAGLTMAFSRLLI